MENNIWNFDHCLYCVLTHPLPLSLSKSWRGLAWYLVLKLTGLSETLPVSVTLWQERKWVWTLKMGYQRSRNRKWALSLLRVWNARGLTILCIFTIIWCCVMWIAAVEPRFLPDESLLTEPKKPWPKIMGCAEVLEEAVSCIWPRLFWKSFLCKCIRGTSCFRSCSLNIGSMYQPSLGLL